MSIYECERQNYSSPPASMAEPHAIVTESSLGLGRQVSNYDSFYAEVQKPVVIICSGQIHTGVMDVWGRTRLDRASGQAPVASRGPSADNQ